MIENLLGENQRRRVATHLRLLEDDLASLLLLPALHRPGMPYERIRERVGQIEREVAALREAFGLSDEGRPTLRRHVAAVGEIWCARVEDLRARRLKGYGDVNPELARHLDPYVDRLGILLGELADAATQLPDA